MTYLALLLMTLGLAGSDINYETAKLERRLKAVKTTEKITLDGRLTEAAWLAIWNSSCVKARM